MTSFYKISIAVLSFSHHTLTHKQYKYSKNAHKSTWVALML